MSREIPQERIESGELDEDEILYLQDRGMLPEYVEPLDPQYYAGGGYPSPDEVPPDLGPLDADEDPQGASPTETDQPDGVEYRLTSDEEYEDYDEGWTNATRRAELTSRGLSVEGKKEDLIARLLRSDADELTEEDQASEDEDDEED